MDDGAVYAVVEYNWSHDNVGGAINVYTQPNRDCDAIGTIIRYNLSENDGIHVFGVHGAAHSTFIYNNTAFVGRRALPAAPFRRDAMDIILRFRTVLCLPATSFSTRVS